MPRYIQLDENNFVTGSVDSATPPVHENQYEISSTVDVTGMILSGGNFYPFKIVPDLEANPVFVSLGEKVSG